MVRPPELQIEGCVIRITRNGPAATSRSTSLGRVISVHGPYPPDPDWYARPRIGGYKIVFEELSEHLHYLTPKQRVGWINEVNVEDGGIYAYPWRDAITVVEWPAQQQVALF